MIQLKKTRFLTRFFVCSGGDFGVWFVLGCLAVVMLVLGKGIFGNVRMFFLLYARIGVINVAKRHDI